MLYPPSYGSDASENGDENGMDSESDGTIRINDGFGIILAVVSQTARVMSIWQSAANGTVFANLTLARVVPTGKSSNGPT